MSFLDMLDQKVESLWDKGKEILSRFIRKPIFRRLRRWYLVSKRQMPNANNNRKLSAIFILGGSIVLLSTLICGRLLYVEGRQMVDGVSLDKKTKELYQGSREVEAKRGTIYDRNGVAIAKDATSYSVYAVLDKDYVGIDNEKLYLQSKNISKVAEIFHKYLNFHCHFLNSY